MNLRVLLVLVMIALLPLAASSLPGTSLVATAHAEESWRGELEELCARTNDAMTFSPEELKRLVEKCDGLKKRLDELDESSRKVYGKRLKMCRDFYAFMLESKQEGAKK